jgi:uncharacterized protein (TIGR02996 family)
MAEQDELLQAVLDNPDDDAPRLAYADWCERQNDEPTRARAEFIQAQILVNHLDEASDPFVPALLREQEQTLRSIHQAAWAAAVAPLVDDYVFNRGFVELASLSARNFLDRSTQLFSLAPVRHLDLNGVREVAQELFASPQLLKIRSLRMNACSLDDDNLKLLAASENASALRWLSLANNDIGLEGIAALAASPFLKELVYLNLSGNPVDPVERYAHDNGNIVDQWLPESGEMLEARFGYLRWLHIEARTIDATPNRFRIGL